MYRSALIALLLAAAAPAMAAVRPIGGAREYYMDRSEIAMRQALRPFHTRVRMMASGGYMITLPGEMTFAAGATDIERTAERAITSIAGVLVRFPRTRINVTAHTDAQGSPKANLQLSEARAQAVGNFLVLGGISRARLQAAGKGERQPIATNATAKGRAANRRVEIRVRPAAGDW